MKDLIYVTLVIALLVGWAQSIVGFVNCDFESPYKCEAVYGIGILVPIIGGVVGWMHIEDGKK